MRLADLPSRRARLVAAGAAALALAGACADPTSSTGPAAAAGAKGVAPVGDDAQYVVSFHEDQMSVAAARSLMTRGGGVLRALQHTPALVVTAAEAERWRKDPRVRSVVPNRKLRTLHQTGPNQWGARYVVAGWQWDMRQIKVLPTMANDGRTTLPVSGAGTKVCIIDTGIDPNHVEFAGKIVATKNFFDGTTQVLDSVGHGSHVAGTVTSALRRNIASMAPDAQLLVAKVFADNDVADDAGFWDAYAWCGAQGADAVNMSFGFSGGGIPIAGNEAYIAEERLRLQQLAQTGAVITASAGNDNLLLPVAGRENLPALSPYVVSVAATGPTINYPFSPVAPNSVYDTRASYSNYGQVVTVFAPGGNAGGTTNPRAITSVCSGFQLGAGRIASGCGGSDRMFMAIQGTSMAAPHVAGLAALIKSRPDFAGPRSDDMRQRIIRCIISTSDAMPAASPFFGRPRINALRATTEACGNAP